jgi:hypothetical protein
LDEEEVADDMKISLKVEAQLEKQRFSEKNVKKSEDVSFA